ncbi:MAG: hypothetical protein COA79_18530 [Planctomycetota bacterium]|nr:MAG: hypothetical protein COA79_18530 [Planctomycetota bacterium]
MDEEMQDPIDKAVLKRAMKAFRKRLKTFRLDDESGLNQSAFSSGKVSGIVAIKAPDYFPKEVWDELVKQGRLLESDSMYELND